MDKRTLTKTAVTQPNKPLRGPQFIPRHAMHALVLELSVPPCAFLPEPACLNLQCLNKKVNILRQSIKQSRQQFDAKVIAILARLEENNP